MTKILFLPFSLVGGLVAGFVGKKVFAGIWQLVDEEEPPDPKHRRASWVKVIAALLLEGAIFRAARGIADRASRKVFSRLTGKWPGEERPEPA
jgi:hypothetical protein